MSVVRDGSPRASAAPSEATDHPPQTVLAEATAGLVLAIVNATAVISMAALIFAPMPADAFLIGVAALLVSSVICALGGAFYSGFPAVVLSPRSGVAPIYAGMVASLAPSFAAGSPAAVPTVLAAMMAATLVTAVFLYLLGRLRLGDVVRYVPFPVMAGFFAGKGT